MPTPKSDGTQAPTPTPPTTESRIEVLVTYGMTTFDSVAGSLESISAEEFLANFNSVFHTTGSASSFSAVEAVPGSATTSVDSYNFEASVSPSVKIPWALMPAIVCRLIF
jgi:hypothetical protein